MRKPFILIRASAAAYLKFADIYKMANSSLCYRKAEINWKLCNRLTPVVTRSWPRFIIWKNYFSKAADAYSRFAMGPVATEEDLVKYACFILETMISRSRLK